MCQVFRLMSDNDVQGQVSRLMDICQLPPWCEFWQAMDCTLYNFADLNLSNDATDAEIWHACQEKGVVLITGNRNAEGPNSLEATIRSRSNSRCLPVLTLADPNRILYDRAYASLVVERLFDVLVDIEEVLGVGRLYLP